MINLRKRRGVVRNLKEMGGIRASRNSNTLTLHNKTITAIWRDEYVNPLADFQRWTNLFGFMELNSLSQFELSEFVAKNVGMWGPVTNCNNTNRTPGVRMISQTLTPCPIELDTSFCPTSVIDSCFQSLLKIENGNLENDDLYELAAQVIETMLSAASENYFGMLMAGQYYSESLGLTPVDSLSLEDKAAVLKSEPTCEGLLAKLRRLKDPCNVFPDGPVSDECGYTGSALAAYVALKNCACGTPLQGILQNGYVSPEMETPLIIVSSTMYNSLWNDYNAELQTSQTNGRRFMLTQIPDGPALLSIDRIPIIPIAHLNIFDWYYGMKTDFMALTVSGNINIGSSFRSAFAGQDYARIWRNPDPRAKGELSIYANNLAATAIGSLDHIVYGIQTY